MIRVPQVHDSGEAKDEDPRNPTMRLGVQVRLRLQPVAPVIEDAVTLELALDAGQIRDVATFQAAYVNHRQADDEQLLRRLDGLLTQHAAEGRYVFWRKCFI